LAKPLKYFIVFLLCLPALLTAEEKSLLRRYVPIVVQGSAVPSVAIAFAEWRAYRYQSVSGSWRLVPYQVDEKDLNKYGELRYNHEKEGIVDGNDELVFMPEDLGDRAPADVWLADTTAQSHPRFEFEFQEANDLSRKAWVYLYHSAEAPVGYMSHQAAPAATAADTVISPVYRIGHNRDGWIDFISLQPTPQTDLIDRFKLRITGETTWGNIGKYAFVEDTLNNGRSSYYSGLIRAFHTMRSDLVVPQIQPNAFDVDYDLHYMPYSIHFGVNDKQLENPYYLVVAGARQIRQSLDLNANAVGMTFYSEHNLNGFPVDGSADAAKLALSSGPGAHWVMASGPRGTLFMVMEMPDIKNTVTQLYYRDDRSGGSNDGTSDSGDGESFSDMGLAVSGGVLVTNRVTLKFSLFLLSERSRDASFADTMFAWIKSPLTVNASEQAYTGNGVERRPEVVDGFRLEPLYPNPFRPGEDAAQLRLHLPAAPAVFEVRIINILGQPVAHWSGFAAGLQQIRWGGRDDFGRPLAQGVYQVIVESAGQRRTQKTLLLR
jgi:hypothetical protein